MKENLKKRQRKRIFLFQEFKAFKPPKENYGFRYGFIWLCLMKRVKRPPTVFVRFSYGFRTVFVGLRVFQRFLITACCCEDIWFKQRKILGPLHRTFYLAWPCQDACVRKRRLQGQGSRARQVYKRFTMKPFGNSLRFQRMRVGSTCIGFTSGPTTPPRYSQMHSAAKLFTFIWWCSAKFYLENGRS